MERHAQYIKTGGSWPGGVDHCSGISQQVVSNCTVHHLSFLGCYFVVVVVVVFLFIMIIIILS